MNGRTRVLVTGASGFVGAALCRELLARGHAVDAVVRRNTGGSLPGLRYVFVEDIAEGIDRRTLENADVIVHLAAMAHRAGADESQIRQVNVAGAALLAKQAADNVRRFVFLSSAKVHGEDSGDGAFTESDPLRPEDAYGRSKRDAEQALADIAAASGMELVVIRPPLVYGPRVRANFLRLLEWVDSARPLPFGAVHNRRSLIYIGNLVDAIIGCATHPGASGPFLVSDAEILSTAEMISHIGRALGLPRRLVSVPVPVLRLAGRLTGRGEDVRRLTGNFVVDASRAAKVLGWRPPFPAERGLVETVQWYKSIRRGRGIG
jgi:UDP-glucose 4-epimerase